MAGWVGLGGGLEGREGGDTAVAGQRFNNV